MRLRAYKTEDCEAMAGLFYDTVHRVNARDYPPEQLDAWATGMVDLPAWNARYLSSTTLVAEENGALLGFANMDKTGYLDMLYVHADAQNRGIATALCDALEHLVNAETFTTHASITARPFFEKRGYVVVRQQNVPLRGQILTNFVMEKRRKPPFSEGESRP
ncbi:MAG: GNAT family N-acetyltransferase [Candidatus Spyradocola sp.]